MTYYTLSCNDSSMIAVMGLEKYRQRFTYNFSNVKDNKKITVQDEKIDNVLYI